MRKGNHNCKGKVCAVFTTPEMYGTTWVLYLRTGEDGSDFVNYKLVANGQAPQKANYWLGWKVSEGRVCGNTSLTSLLEHRIDLLACVVDYLKQAG